MPVASLFGLLIVDKLIGIYVIQLASKRILPFISTQRTHKSVFSVEMRVCGVAGDKVLSIDIAVLIAICVII
ncbi:hypothetical protein [Citrobacter freundii]|uniref:hypothetical protein n=1 Tax=Citrobacter freundii TaxID=546 RepID=UPI001121AC45|nr:hypothetical protein [Citrobacter freundii]